jgi:hypothetical protein
MTPERATEVLRRLIAIWPRERSEDTDKEWLYYLRPLDYLTAMKAMEGMRDMLSWPPAIADFRAAYRDAILTPENAIHGEVKVDDSLFDLYGSSQSDWAYCWKCDMAITLAERSNDPHYRDGKGLHHDKCPKSGASPTMPVWMRLEREDAKKKVHHS